MDDDVGTVLDRPDEIGRGHGVVDDERQAVLAGNGEIAAMSTKVPPGLARLSMKMGLGLVVDVLFDGGRIAHVGPAHMPVEALEGMAELVDGHRRKAAWRR